MKFIGKDGQEVDLKILGYQFPSNFDNEWDTNWLKIYLNIKSNACKSKGRIDDPDSYQFPTAQMPVRGA